MADTPRNPGLRSHAARQEVPTLFQNRVVTVIPTAWLERRGAGYEALSQEERDAMMHFVFLWSFFESVALNRGGSAAAIVGVAAEWRDAKLLTEETFQTALLRNFPRARRLSAATMIFKACSIHCTHLSRLALEITAVTIQEPNWPCASSSRRFRRRHQSTLGTDSC